MDTQIPVDFKLTASQEELLQPLFRQAESAKSEDRPGIIYAQLSPEGCKAFFAPYDDAKYIQAASYVAQSNKPISDKLKHLREQIGEAE